VLKSYDVRKLIADFSPIKAQPRKKFFVVPSLLQSKCFFKRKVYSVGLNKEDIYDSQSPVIYILFLEWVEQNLELRNEVLNWKAHKLGEDRRAEPVVDPDTLEG
jgi:hypothetical protein